jgi:hypothetical protein
MLAKSLHWALLRLRYALFRRRILVKAVNRGVVGGDRRWQAVAAAVALSSAIRATTKPTPEILSVERLTPGQSVLVRSLGPRKKR